MTRHEGTQGVALVECANRRKQTYIVRADIQPKETEESPNGVTFIQHQFDHKPTMAEIKEFVIGVVDAQTDNTIVSGLVWTPQAGGDPVNVWLSRENQINFKAAYDLAVQKHGATLPVTFKMGETGDDTPVYHTFETMEDAEDFYLHAVAFIQQTLAAGWQKKDTIDWTPYEQALTPKTEESEAPKKTTTKKRSTKTTTTTTTSEKSE